METGVGEEPCHLSKDFSFLKRRSLVTRFSPHMFQFNRELEGNGLKGIRASRTQKIPVMWRFSCSPATNAGG